MFLARNAAFGKRFLYCLGAIAVLFFVPLVVYWPCLKSPFVFDSALNILDANSVRWEYASLRLTRWLTTLSFLSHHVFFGPDPFYYRVGNLVLHSLNGFLVGVLARALLDKFSPVLTHEKKTILVFLTVMLFILHPLAVYGVAYAIQRSILLTTFFSLLSTLCYGRALLSGRARWFYVAAVFYYLGLAAKETCVMLPAVLFLSTFVFRPVSLKSLNGIFLPLFLMGLCAFFFTTRQQEILGQVYEPIVAQAISSGQSFGETGQNFFLTSIVFQGFLFFRYLFLWVVPYLPWVAIDLSFAFPATVFAMPEIFGFVFYLLFPLGSFFLWRRGGAWRIVATALLWPWFLFWTEFTVVRLTESFVLYRSYLWMSGVFPVLPFIFARIQMRHLLMLGFATLAILTGLTINRVQTFTSPLAVWQDAVDKIDLQLPPERLFSAGRSLSNLGKYLAMDGRYAESLQAYTRALAYQPRHYKNYCGIGANQSFLKKYPEALAAFDRCRELNPAYEQAYYNLGNVYNLLGDTGMAEKNFLQAIELGAEKVADAYFNLGNLYLRQSKFERAEKMYRDYLSIRPHDLDASKNLAFVLYKMGRANLRK